MTCVITCLLFALASSKTISDDTWKITGDIHLIDAESMILLIDSLESQPSKITIEISSNNKCADTDPFLNRRKSWSDGMFIFVNVPCNKIKYYHYRMVNKSFFEVLVYRALHLEKIPLFQVVPLIIDNYDKLVDKSIIVDDNDMNHLVWLLTLIVTIVVLTTIMNLSSKNDRLQAIIESYEKKESDRDGCKDGCDKDGRGDKDDCDNQGELTEIVSV